MKAFITGGAGFIGSHLSERLVREGWRVSVLDDLSTGSLDNLARVRDADGFSFEEGDVRDADRVAAHTQACDVVIHLAAAVGVQTIMTKPSQSLLANVGGTEAALAAASAYDKPILIASTSEVYGKSAQIPFSEDDDLTLGSPGKIRWSYAFAKAVDECLAVACAHEGKARPIIARFFNTTGPRQTGRYGMVLPNFIDAALAGRPLIVHGDGKQTRSFGHVRDAVEAIVRLIAAPQAIGQIYNVGNDEEISIGALAQLVCEMTGSRSEIRFIPYDQAYGPGFEDMPRRVPRVSKLEAAIGFRPNTPLRQIIADIIAEKRCAGG